MKSEEEFREARIRNRRKKRRARMAGLILILILFTILTVQIIRARVKYHTVVVEEETLEEQKKEEADRAKDLEKEKAYRQTDEFKEDEAQTRLGMVHDNQTIFREKED